MNLETLVGQYITVPGISLDLGIPVTAAQNLSRRREFPQGVEIFGRWVFDRDAYLQWKVDYAVSIREYQEKHAVKAVA